MPTHEEEISMPRQSPADTFRANPAENYERYFVPAIGEPLAQSLVAEAGLRPGERVLDVACGTGVVARLAADEVGLDGFVAGIDLNPAMIAVARAYSQGWDIAWQVAAAEALPLPDRTFDVILCQMGLQFFADPLGALEEMRRVLRLKGRLILNVPGPTPAAFAVLEDGLARHVGPTARDFVHVVFSLHDARELCRLLESAGFVGIRTTAATRSLHLPPPQDFLWQYMLSTPLAHEAARLGNEGRAALERDMVAGWQPFVDEGDDLCVDVRVTMATARV
jgi:ubiquinone/menaquinone biosynthesis C-methylase UbiE